MNTTSRDNHNWSASLWRTTALPVSIRRSSTVAGKVAWTVHTAVAALLLISSLWSVLQPVSEGTGCAVQPFLGTDPYVGEYLEGLIRLVNWWGIGFFFFCCLQCSLLTSSLLVVFLAGAAAINHTFISKLQGIDPTRIPQECFDGLLAFVVVVCVVEGGVLLLILYEHYYHSCNNHHNSTTVAVSEATPLV